jgi:formate hydrogenlyase subunit 6/NADH:ubiquinone oxidoreductase subunit I
MMARIKGLSLNKPGEIFLCRHCLDVMCEDCISIADEYQYQYHSFKQAAMAAQDKLVEANREIDRLKRQAEMWEKMAKLGYADVIQQWMDSAVARKLSAARAEGEG